MQLVSRALSKEEKRYSTFEQEAVTVIFFLKTFFHYLLSEPFIVYSDHQALRAAFGKTDVYGRLARWLNLMAEYDFEIRHLPGDRNFIADCLSQSVDACNDGGGISDPQIDAFLAKSQNED